MTGFDHETLPPTRPADPADEGRIPPGLSAAVAAELAEADAWIGKKDVAKARAAFLRAAGLLFNRELHFDGLTSPLADDPEHFLEPLHRSAIGAALGAPRGRLHPVAPVPTHRAQRILFITRGNANFIPEIRERYAQLEQTTVRSLDLLDEPLVKQQGRLIGAALNDRTDFGKQVEQWIRPHLNWADTVFIDWCVAPAAFVTLVDPGTTRIIVRLHRYEAFTVWPHLVDFSRVDDLIFVSDHLRDLTTAAVPRLTGPNGPRLHVLSNAMDLQRFVGEKSADARFTLGMVGFGGVPKDPRWAIQVLRLLRAEDPRYRLVLVGSEMNPNVSPAAARYHAALQQDLAELEAEGAVKLVGQTSDVPGALKEIGVLLSSSVGESFHCAVMEGAASGAVPVVRDWPFFPGPNRSTRKIFPNDWVVDVPQEAAARILALTSSEEVWQAAGRAASAHALATWDWSLVQRDFDRLVLRRPGYPVRSFIDPFVRRLRRGYRSARRRIAAVTKPRV